jgi:hypothetical protein
MYSLLRGVVGAELNNFSIRCLAFTLPPQRIQLFELIGRKPDRPVLVMANVYENIQNDYAVSNHSNPHIASVVSSFIKMFLPTIAGCAQVGLSAT